MGKIIGFIVVGGIVVLMFNEFPEEMAVALGLGVIGAISSMIFKK